MQKHQGRSRAAVAALATLMVLAFVSIAGAGLQNQPVITQLSDSDMGLLLNEMGAPYQQAQANLFVFETDGVKVVLYNHGTSIQLHTFFEVWPSPQKINQWNANKRFCRAYLNNDGKAAIESDLDLAGGVTIENFGAFFRTYRMQLGEFKTFLAN
jgi:hypothetical protein